MPRSINKLTAVGVKNAAPGKHSDGGGLWLYKRSEGGCAVCLATSVLQARKRLFCSALPVQEYRERSLLPLGTLHPRKSLHNPYNREVKGSHTVNCSQGLFSFY